MNDGLVCWKCGHSLDDIPRPLSRYQPCRQCGADLYVCRMCLHHDPRRANACREERAEAPLSKETANFCDWFAPRAGAWDGKGAVGREALEALFGGTAPAPQAPDPVREAAEALFQPKKPD